jgi:hypothetical protein
MVVTMAYFKPDEIKGQPLTWSTILTRCLQNTCLIHFCYTNLLGKTHISLLNFIHCENTIYSITIHANEVGNMHK